VAARQRDRSICWLPGCRRGGDWARACQVCPGPGVGWLGLVVV